MTPTNGPSDAPAERTFGGGVLTQEFVLPRKGQLTSVQIRLAVWGSVVAACVLLAPAIATMSIALRGALAVGMVATGAAAGVSIARLVRRQRRELLGARSPNGEEQLRAEALANVTVEAIAVVEADRVIDVNRAFAEIFDYPPEEIVGKSVLEVIERDAQVLVRNKILTESREPLCGITGLTRSGARIPVEFRFHLVNHHGRSLRACLFRDLSEQQQREATLVETERQLRHAQKMEAVGQLAAGIAHDFNNILTVISGHCDLLSYDVGSDERCREDIDEIRAAGLSAASLTRQLLAFSRKQVQQLEILRINDMISEVSRMLRRLMPEVIQLVIEPGAGVGRVQCDRGQIEQVIMNLAVNARDAMPSGGRLVISTGNATLDRAYLQAHAGAREGDFVRITVRDTGIGMDAETRSRVFEPFFTTKEKGKGTGLGLATVFGIVKQSGGYIDVESEVGVGTCFHIYLPRTLEEADEGRDDLELAPAIRGSGTILLVEDSRPVRQLTVRILERHGYAVLAAARPDEAIAVAANHEGEIAVILTDVVMPAMSGPEMASRMRLSRPDVHVIYMSGYVGEPIDELRRLDPEAVLLEKPFSPDTLLDAVQNTLRGSRRKPGTLASLDWPRD